MRWQVLNMADISACPNVFASLKGIADVISLPAKQRKLLEKIHEFDVYFASLHVQMNREVLERASHLRVIATPSTGLDHIDITFARQRGVAILSLTQDTEFLEKITATAEMTWALLLATVRRLPWAFAAAKQGDWARDRFRGWQLSGKTLGILGYGRLGRMVAEYGKAFRMRVLTWDIRKVTPADGVELVSFERLLRESDVLSIHIHLTDENRGLINSKALAKMKNGAILINTSRGGLVDEEAFLQALLSGHLGGAGLDVIDGEWRDDLEQHPLIRYVNAHENLVISPHVGGVTFESQKMTLEYTVERLMGYLVSLC